MQYIDELKKYIDASQQKTTDTLLGAMGIFSDKVEGQFQKVDKKFEVIKTEIVGVRGGLKTEIVGVRDELKTDIASVRDELKTEIHTEVNGLRSEMQQGFFDTNQSIKSLHRSLEETNQKLEKIRKRSLEDSDVQVKDLQGMKKLETRASS